MTTVASEPVSLFEHIRNSVLLKISLLGIVLLVFGAAINTGPVAGFFGIYGVIFFILGLVGYGLLLTARYYPQR